MNHTVLMNDSGWSKALESLNEYNRNSYNLPEDNSLISPIARVILQKRRLLKIQEIHNLLLEVSSEPSESLTQGEYEKEFLMKFRPTFARVRWNELSGCEALALSGLIVDTLYRCQADAQFINQYIKEAVAEINAPEFKTRAVALRSSLILVRCIFKAFPKQAGAWANDLLKAILNNFKLSHTSSNCFDCVLEGLKCLKIILRLPTKFIDVKEREKVPSTISKYLTTKSTFIAIESAKVLEEYYESVGSVTKKDVKEILENLNGGLSLRLYEHKCSARLLEYCFELRPEKGTLSHVAIGKNVERIRGFSYIDPRLFSDAFANCLVRKLESDGEDEVLNILLLLLPFKGSKTFVSAKCFAKTVEFFIERILIYNDCIKMIRFIVEKVLHEKVIHFSDDYMVELIEILTRLYIKFPESLNENDFSSFVPLTRPNNNLQLKSVELIAKVLKDHPIVLSSQVTLIFAQLKGDFLRLKLQEKTVIRDAVNGLLKLFAKILKISLENYSNYCDHEMISKVQEWILSQLKLNEDTEWLRKDEEIIEGILLVASVLSKYNVLENTSAVIEFMDEAAETLHCHSILDYFLHLISFDPENYKLFGGSIEKCLLVISNQKQHRVLSARKLFLLMKLIAENNKINEFNSADTIVLLVAKLISFSEYYGSASTLLGLEKEYINFTQLTEYFSKLFWRTSEETQQSCLNSFVGCLKDKKAIIPSQILQTIRSILECSEIKISNPVHQNFLVSKVQAIMKYFLLDDNFEVRLECGIVLGSIVRLFDSNDTEVIHDLFKQSMKHAMRSSDVNSQNQKSRVCYIMGIVSLKANLENDHVKAAELTSNALMGLIASWNRENNFENKFVDREIAAASIFALAYFIEKCGCYVNSEFYRDSCELLLEQVLMKDICETMVKSVRQLAKSLALYVNLLPSQSQFIMKTIRLLLESSYLTYYGNDCIELLLDISGFNPQITFPSSLIYVLLKLNIGYHTKGAYGNICQYLNLQVSTDNSIAFHLIDSGIIMFLLERANNPECFDGIEYESLSFLVKKVMSLTIVERFDFWMDSVFEPLNLSGGERINSKVSASDELSNSAFSLTDLKESLKPSLTLRPSTVLLLLGPLSQNISRLVGNPSLKKFLNFAIRICFNISAEKANERKFYLAGITLFRGIVRTFSTILDDNESSILEPFDSQIISIISSALRYSEDGDPLYAACAFGSLFSLVSNRKDLQEDLKSGTGRVCNLVRKAIVLLKEHKVLWTVEMVENLILLSIIVGFCSLQQSGFDLDVLDSELNGLLKRAIGDCFVAYKLGKLEKNIKLSLSGQDRLLLIKNWSIIDISDVESEEIDGILSVLVGMNSDNMEQVCNLAVELFKRQSIESASPEILAQLLDQISSFGLEKNDPLAIECILPLIESCNHKDIAAEALNKLSGEFLTSRFNDFDTPYGIAAVKAQQSLMSSIKDQRILFGILKKLIGNCLNDLEVNNCKEMLKSLKLIFANPHVSPEYSNELLVEWIGRLEEVDSIFLNQLVFFSVSSQPQIWGRETFASLRKHFEKMLKSVNTLEMALDSWILLLKAKSKKSNGYSEAFNEFVNYCTDRVIEAFGKFRGEGIDPVWERIFGITQSICNSSEVEMSKIQEISSEALEELNDFK